jgi:ADP-ribosylglycohydrolase
MPFAALTDVAVVIGAIAGDIIGSVYEHRPLKTKAFPLFQSRSAFTDDTVLTVAVADAVINGGSFGNGSAMRLRRSRRCDG